RDEATDSLLTGLPVTRIEPIELRAINRWKASISGRLAKAELQRSYILVPKGSAQIEWRVRAANPHMPGSLRWYLYRPDGELAYVSDWLGNNHAYSEERLALHGVEQGVWEIVIEAAPGSSAT